MMKITRKSIGMLYDELITNGLKIKHIGETEDLLIRREQLVSAVTTIDSDRERDEEKDNLVYKLEDVLEKCWNAQETVMRYAKLIDELEKETNSYYVETDFPKYFTTCARAAIDAQRYNAQRNKLIRQIDEYLGELSISPTIKSYSEE